MDNLKYHMCNRNDAWDEYDARGIYLCRVCDICVDAKLSTYRPDVLRNSNYITDEAIYPADG